MRARLRTQRLNWAHRAVAVHFAFAAAHAASAEAEQTASTKGIQPVPTTASTERYREDLKGLPWLQPLSYSLSPVVRDLRRPLVFRMLRPDNLSAIILRAQDDGTEVLTIGGREVRARRIKVSPAQRLVGSLIHSVYWFRETDGLFVRFEGPVGIGGMGKHVVEWVPESPYGDAEGVDK